jgi:hypothetical protein
MKELECAVSYAPSLPEEERRSLVEFALPQDMRIIMASAIPAYFRAFMRGRKDAALTIHDFMNAPKGKKFEHLFEGLVFAHDMRLADRAVNNFYWDFTHSDLESGKLLFQYMEDPSKGDHNRGHIRRVEEWVEFGVGLTENIRHGSWEHRFWLVSLYLAKQFHDFTQLLSGKKEAHPELAAWWLMSATDMVAKSMGVKSEVAWMWTRGAAAMILHHSNPEELDEFGRNITCESISNICGNVSSKHRQNLPDVFWKDFETEMAKVANTSMPLTAGFTRRDLNVITRFSKILGWGDKCDSAIPGDLGDLRTSLAGPAKEREIYIVPDNPNMSVLEEFLSYVPAGKHNSDVGRKIHEKMRRFTTGGNDKLGYIAMHNAIVSAYDDQRVYLSLMSNDASIIDSVFDKRLDQLMNKALKRSGYRSEIIRTQFLRRCGHDLEFFRGYCRQEIYDAFIWSVRGIGIEKAEVIKAFGLHDGGHNKMLKRNGESYSELEKERVFKLFQFVIEVLADKLDVLPEDTKDWEYILPYSGYDPLSRPEEMRRSQYRH